MTYDEEGGYPHPDHIQTHRVSIEAFDAAGDPDRYPAAGQPWQPLKLYYHTGFTTSGVALHEEMLAHGVESPYGEWLELGGSAPIMPPASPPGCRAGEYFELRDDALRAHATQIDPDGWWFPVPLRCTSRNGQPRTTSWSRASCRAISPRTTCSRGYPRASTRLGQWRHDLLAARAPGAGPGPDRRPGPGGRGRQSGLDGVRDLPAPHRGRRAAGLQPDQAPAPGGGRGEGGAVRLRQAEGGGDLRQEPHQAP